MCEMCLFVSADRANENVAPGPLFLAAISGGAHIGETGDAAGTSAKAYSVQLGFRRKTFSLIATGYLSRCKAGVDCEESGSTDPNTSIPSSNRTKAL